jgi:hypothetical protein
MILLLGLASSLQAATVKVILVTPGANDGSNIKQFDNQSESWSALPSNAAFSIGTFVADPDTNQAAIAALLSSGSAVTNLTNSNNFLTFGTISRSLFSSEGSLTFEFDVAAFKGKSIFLVAYNNSNPNSATQVGVYRFYDDANLPTPFDDFAGTDTEIFSVLLPESNLEPTFAVPFFGQIVSTGALSADTFLAYNADGLAITSGNPTDAVKDELYSYPITANNGATSYSVTKEDGQTGLPNGLVVNTATGVISGTPTVTGNFTFTLRANNPLFVDVTKVVILTVNAPAGDPPAITPIGAQTAYRGTPFSLIVLASNNPTGFSLSGAPLGFSISALGVVTGTTTAETGTYTLSIRASGAGGTSDPQLVTLTLANPTITPSQSSVNGAVGSAITPVTFTVVPSGSSPSFDRNSLPDGLTLNFTTGTITGTPTATKTSSSTVTATFSGGVTAQASIDFNIGSPLPVLLAPAPAELEATRGQEFSLTLQRALNGAVGPFTYEQVSGVDLSTIGLNLQQEATQNTAAGVINGTPNAIGVYSASFRAYSSSGTSNILPITITVDPAQPVINCELNRTAGVGLPFRHVFTSNDPLHDKVALRLPPGLTFERNVSFNKSFFDMIYGVPTTPGSFPVTLIASTQKFSGSTISTSTTLNIKVEGSRPNASALGIRSGTFRLNEPTHTTYAPSEGFFLTGSDMGANSTIYMNATGLPPGLGFGKKRDGTDGSTTEKTVARRRGLITGTPTKAGRYPITLYVQNGFGNTKTSIVFTVLP